MYMHRTTDEKHTNIKDLVVSECSQYRSGELERLTATVNQLIDLVGDMASILTEEQRNRLASRRGYRYI